jgi:tetratricopeptide (TPR) repeat protein
MGGAACDSGNSADTKTPANLKNGQSNPYGVDEQSAAEYKQLLQQMEDNDKANSWNADKCNDLAKKFIELNERQSGGKFFAPAVYNAGVSYHRCGNIEEARKQYQEVLDKDPKFHRARVQIARFDLAAAGDAGAEKAMGEFSKAVADSEFQNVEALVELARLQMKRNNNVSDSDGANDLERSKKNLQRALAVDDGFMPAFNQLAIYYLERARQNAGKKGGKVQRGAHNQKLDTQALDLALLVASQAVRKNPNYGPIHNTSGLVAIELGDLNKAVVSFGRARQLDPTFFEAHMNYAAVNLLFRGFAPAEEAYRAAIKLRPNDYDAHLGLALALRGQIDSASNGDAKLAEADAEIEAAKKIDAARPEAYFNQAILTQEYKARAGGDAANKALDQAIALFTDFKNKAQGKAEFADAVEDVTAVPSKPDSYCVGAKAKTDKGCKIGRIKDIQDTISFNKQSEADRKKMEEEAKNKAALEEAQTGDQTGADAGGAGQ